jgi:Meckel syndrome type 1 protein
LNASAVLKAFPEQSAVALPAGAVRFAPALAPAAASPAAAALTAPAASDPSATAASPAPEALPPSAAAQGRGTPGVPVAPRRRDPALEKAVGALAARLEAAGGETSQTLREAGPVDQAPDESADALGRRVFDRSMDRALLASGEGSSPSVAANGGFASGVAGASARNRAVLSPAGFPSASPLTTDGEVLRDAVAAVPAAALLPRAGFTAPTAAASAGVPAASVLIRGGSPAFSGGASGVPSAASPSFERLSLELGSGLVVTVRSALHLAAPVEAKPSVAAEDGASAKAARFAAGPAASTEWLERRGLLETLSASEATAVQTARAARAEDVVHAPARPASPRQAPSDGVPSPALWALAFLPAAAVLLKKLR